MKIVVLDGYTENPGDISWAPLEALGELVVYDRTAYEESPLIAERIGDADVAVTNKTPISRETIDRCPSLKAVAVLATGYNVVDCAYAGEKGIPVMNVPVYGTDNVSQYAVALLLELCSHVGHHSDSVHAGEWSANADWCYWHYPMIEVSQKTAGIIGLGRIGVHTAKILRAMNVRVLAYDTHPSDAGREVAEYVPLDRLLAASDFIFLHCPLFPETQGIINRDTIAKMKDGVLLINNSRGPLVVEQDLFNALESGKVAAAAVDVVSTEPISPDNVLLKARNCIITPHISWATREARERIMQTTADNIRAFLAGTLGVAALVVRAAAWGGLPLLVESGLDRLEQPVGGAAGRGGKGLFDPLCPLSGNIPPRCGRGPCHSCPARSGRGWGPCARCGPSCPGPVRRGW